MDSIGVQRQKSEMSEILPPWTWSISDLSNKNFPPFTRPKEIGCFSKVKEKSESQLSSIYSDCRALAKYQPVSQANLEKKNVDLNEGIKKWVPEAIKDCDDPCFLQWLTETKKDLNGIDFVCWRGLLTYLATTPYETRDEWLVAAIKSGGAIFLFRYETEAQLRSRMDQMRNERQRRFCYWGFRFEKYMTEYESKSTDPTIRDDSYVSVVETQLDEFRLLFGGEVDCIDLSINENTSATSTAGDNSTNNLNENPRPYVELKTSRTVETPNQERIFKNQKLLKWWLQSFLIGVPRIVAGFRDDSGLVHNLREYKVADMHQLAREFWKPSVCFNFLVNFLRHVKTTLQNSTCEEVFLFRWKPSMNRYQVQCEKYTEYCKYNFLPQYFMDK